MVHKEVLYYGTLKPVAERHYLRAGPLSVVYEEGDLRYIRLGEREVLRRVYVAVRDHNWGTVAAQLSNVTLEQGQDWFHIDYLARHQQHNIDFSWHGTITGDTRGKITFAMSGQANTAFLRNRIGFCVLHPVQECAGQPCLVEKIDGTAVTACFPDVISPHQPFFDIAALTHEVIPGVEAKVRFAGDVFEMEDQRNWTDASYKTYCTPLALPFPVKVEQGERVTQMVTLTLQTTSTGQDLPALLAGLHTTPSTVSVRVGAETGYRLPPLGLGVASHGERLSERELDCLRLLRLGHLRVDLHLACDDYCSTLDQAHEEATALNVGLEIALTLTDNAEQELATLLLLLQELKPTVIHWLIFHEREKSTSRQWVVLARRYLSTYAPGVPVGSGTNMYFTELNRGRPSVADLDLVCYSINPQVHAFDDASLVETLAAQAETVKSARALALETPIVISPVTLKPRFNPDATGPEPELLPNALPSQVDARQLSLFGAGWTLGSIKYLAESGVARCTYYETTGWQGVMELAQGSPLPEAFPSLAGSVFPLYHVFVAVNAFTGSNVLHLYSQQPLTIDGLALHTPTSTRILLANFTAQPQAVAIDFAACTGEYASLRYLDERNVLEAMLEPATFWSRPGEPLTISQGRATIHLLPFGLACIDIPNTPDP